MEPMSLQTRVAPWVDWVIALAVGIVVLNLNVTAAGDPLSGVGLSAGPSSPGITETGRGFFYATLGAGGTLLLVAGLVIAAVGRPTPGLLAVRTFGFVVGVSLAGLLLDYRDGPVRLVHLAAYVAVALAGIRLVRIAVALAGEPVDHTSGAPDRHVNR